MNPGEILQRIMVQPSAEDLWQLHPYLLATGDPALEPVIRLVRCFHHYLSEVQSKLSSKDYSEMGARLAAGSIGVIATKDIVETFRKDRDQALTSMLAGGLAAMLETLSTFQHVKAWETEFTSVHETALWEIYTGLWALSSELKPSLPLEERHALIDQLLQPARHPDMPGAGRVALLVRLYQLLLVARIVPILCRLEDSVTGEGTARV